MSYDTSTVRDSEEPRSPLDAGRSRGRAGSTELRVVLVDDEPLSRARLRSILEDEPDVTVVGECADGWEAVRAIHALDPDLVFLDVALPDLDGFGVPRESDVLIAR